MADSSVLSNNFVIQNLLQQADELTRQPFGLNSKLTLLGDEQYLTSNVVNVNNSTDSNTLKIEEIDEFTANQLLQTLSPAYVQQPQYQVIEGNSANNATVEIPSSALTTTYNYGNQELYQDPNPPQVIRRPPAQGPITYRQNVSVRFLQPPPVPPPGVSFLLLKLIQFTIVFHIIF